MLFYRRNPGPIVEVHKDAPHVGTPYVPKKRRVVFYEYDPEMEKIIGGYSEGPKISYARELMERYPLTNE